MPSSDFDLVRSGRSGLYDAKPDFAVSFAGSQQTSGIDFEIYARFKVSRAFFTPFGLSCAGSITARFRIFGL